MKADLVGCFRRFLEYLGAHRLQVDAQAREQAGLAWLEAPFSRGLD
jgi:hypothetical protein